MSKYEKNKPVKQYDQIDLEEAISGVVDSVIHSKTICPDCKGGKNSLGKPLDCRTCNNTGRS